jgi:hypothetical protein
MIRQEDVLRFVALYENDEPTDRPVLLETPFTEIARTTSLYPWNAVEEGCFEIDTQKDYATSSIDLNPTRMNISFRSYKI